MSDTIAQLRARSDDELIAAHDQLAKHTSVGTQHYEDELARRENARSASRVEALTETMKRLTVVITVLTAMNVVLTAVGVWAALR